MVGSVDYLSKKQTDDQADVLKTLAINLRQKRKAKKLSRRVLAEVAGVSQRYLAQIEVGKGNVSIGITPDGPRGPRHKVSEGTINISRISNKKILPMALAYKKKWVLNTWDKFIIPKPFNFRYSVYRIEQRSRTSGCYASR